MSSTSARILQYIVIILVLAVVSGAGYALYQSRAAVTQKTASKSGLIGYWNFEENTGTTAGDMSGNSTTGTLTNGPTWVDGRSGKAVDLDGSNDYVTMGSAATYDDLGSFTVSAWINPDSVSASPRIIMGKTAAGATTGWTVGQSGAGPGKIFVQIMCSSGDLTLRSADNVLSASKWQHVTFVFDGTTAYANQHIYINGVETSYDTAQSTNCSGSRISDAAQDLMLGRDSSTGSYIYGGLVDEARLYNRVLSASEVSAIYASNAAKMSASQNSAVTNGLVGLWSFNGADISGTTAYDRSSSANNGTLTNGPVVAKGKTGQALNFDGTDDYVTAGSPASLDNIANLTTCVWIYPETPPSSYGYRIIDRKTSGTGGEWEFFLYNYGGYVIPGFYRYFSSTNGYWYGEAAIPINTWSHLCVTYDNASASNDPTFYVNGVPVHVTENTAPSGTASSDATEEFRIAWSPGGGFFDGSIDEVRVYSRILSAGEIWDLYQLGANDKVSAADVSLDSLEKGLTGYWKLDENTGTSTADASISGKTGTLTNGPTWATGRIGSGVTLDGTNDYIDIGSSSALADNLSRFSVSTWFKTSAVSCATTNCAMVSKLSAGTTNTGVGWMLAANYNSGSMGQIWLFVQGPTGSYWRSRYTNNQYNDGQWHHAVATFDTSTIVIYIDGAAVGLTADDGGALGSFSNAVNVRIGADTDGNYFPGTVDEVRIYDRALSAEEAAKLYKTTAPNNPDTGLRGYWSFNGADMSGTTVYDRSGAGNNGTLLSGSVPAIGKIGQGIDFDGANGEVAIVDPGTGSVFDFSNGNSITLSAWVNPDTFDSTGGTIITKELNSSTWGPNYSILHSACSGSSCALNFLYDTGSCNGSAPQVFTTTQAVLAANTWQHVAVSYTFGTGSSIKVYVDGVEKAGTWTLGSGSIAPCQGDNELRIGRNYNGTTFDGTIDEVSIYGRAFSATEILDLYTKGK